MNRNERELNELKIQPKTVGLTGGIACGKTVATTALRAEGFFVVDADEVSRSLTAPGTEYEKRVTEMFPAANIGGRLDRRRLRGIIAENIAEKRRLEDFLHPIITAHIRAELDRADRAVLSAPLLFESALSSLCDCTVCIMCPRPIRMSRLMARDGISEHDAEAIIDAQIPDTERATLADFIIPSDCDEHDFTTEVVDLFTRIFALKNNI